MKGLLQQCPYIGRIPWTLLSVPNSGASVLVVDMLLSDSNHTLFLNPLVNFLEIMQAHHKYLQVYQGNPISVHVFAYMYYYLCNIKSMCVKHGTSNV